ncbi:MAG TPA: TfoX/Sxy family protein [Woeseiaceae bacterium]|nr:TfoX/Sxy family protein [Woeseiaceae bacterium]
MSTDPGFVEYIADQVDSSCQITCRRMFGEYGLYARGKFVAVACDNQLFIKPTEAGRSFIGNVVEAPPYAGAKPWFLVRDEIDDAEWLTQLIALTESSLPMPKPKKKRAKNRG